MCVCSRACRSVKAFALSTCHYTKQLMCLHKRPISKVCQLGNDLYFANLRTSRTPRIYINATERNHHSKMCIYIYMYIGSCRHPPCLFKRLGSTMFGLKDTHDPSVYMCVTRACASPANKEQCTRFCQLVTWFEYERTLPNGCTFGQAASTVYANT